MKETNNDIEEQIDSKGWIANVLSSVSVSFNKFIAIFKKNGLLYSLLIMLIFIIFWCFIIHPININDIVQKQLENQIINQKEQTQQAIERRYKADEIVGDIMANLLDKYNVNRVLLLEKHNSVVSLGNVDFLYLSCSLEMLNPNSDNLSYISEDLQRQVVLNLLGNDMLGMLKHKDYIYYKDVAKCTHPQHRLIHKLKNAGDKETLLIPFKDANHRPLLLLVISGENIQVKEIIDYINQFSKQITDLLIC